MTVTGAELFESSAQWGLQAQLSDQRRLGDYQGIANLGCAVGTVWAPAAYTYLATDWHTTGWLLIAGSSSSLPLRSARPPASQSDSSPRPRSPRAPRRCGYCRTSRPGDGPTGISEVPSNIVKLVDVHAVCARPQRLARRPPPPLSASRS